MTSTQVELKNIDDFDVGTPSTGQQFVWDGSNWVNEAPTVEPRVVVFTVNGELSTRDHPIRFYYPFTSGSLKATLLRASVDTAPTGAAVTVRLERHISSGSDAVGTVTISATNHTGSQSTLSNQYLVPGYWWQIEITGVGSTVAGSNLTFQVVCDPIGISKRAVT